MSKVPRQGIGFQWNAGGWFGCQIGGTLWILICAVLLTPKDATVAAAVFAAFLLPNLGGTALWILRHRVAPYPAIQTLLILCWIAAIACIFVAESSGLWHAIAGVPIHTGGGAEGTVSAESMNVMVFLLFPLLMLVFHLIQRQARKADPAQDV